MMPCLRCIPRYFSLFVTSFSVLARYRLSLSAADIAAHDVAVEITLPCFLVLKAQRSLTPHPSYRPVDDYLVKKL